MSPFHKAPPFFASAWSWEASENDESDDAAAFGYEVAVPPAAAVDAAAPRVSAFRGISLVSVLTMTVFLVAFLVARSLFRRFRIPLPRSSTFDLYRKRRSSSSTHVELLPRNSFSSVIQTSWSAPRLAEEPIANVVYDMDDEDREHNGIGRYRNFTCWSQKRRDELQIL